MLFPNSIMCYVSKFIMKDLFYVYSLSTDMF